MKLFSSLFCLGAIVACGLFPDQSSAQTDSNLPHPFYKYDLNRDDKIDVDDVNTLQFLVREEYGSFGIGIQHPTNRRTINLDLNNDGSINIEDIHEILHRFGRFDALGEFHVMPGGDCQMGDINADGEFTTLDYDYFLIGRYFWLWWQEHIGPEPALYSMGDMDFDGDIDEVDFNTLLILLALNDGIVREYPTDDVFDELPERPVGWVTWGNFCLDLED